MNVEDTIAACLLRIRGRLPFFGALALFAEHRLDDTIPTAATDGRSIFFNPGFACSLTPAELDGVMVHEILHAALLHPTRRGERDPLLWNIAADIVVNGIVREEPQLALPGSPLINHKLERFEVEEVYRLLEEDKHPLTIQSIGQDLLNPGVDGLADQALVAEVALHWRNALREAATLSQSMQGEIPASLKLHLEGLLQPQLDWRSLLWRFLVRTPADYGEFDRRFIGHGLYLETLVGEKVHVRVCVDTSGSINGGALSAFVSELLEILRLYPQLDAQLYYADVAVYGPHDLCLDALDHPVGGGGTSFVPFFERMRRDTTTNGEVLLIYLTDGYGTFPKSPAADPVLWVVAPGGLPNRDFPFGEVVRLVDP